MKFTEIERAEIVREFRAAKEPLKQIRIMADLRCCKTADIKNVLIDSGVSVEDVDMRRQPKKTPMPRGNKIKSAVACLEDELAYIEERTAQLPMLIAELKCELEGVEAKRTAIRAAIHTLEGL